MTTNIMFFEENIKQTKTLKTAQIRVKIQKKKSKNDRERPKKTLENALNRKKLWYIREHFLLGNKKCRTIKILSLVLTKILCFKMIISKLLLNIVYVKTKLRLRTHW